MFLNNIINFPNIKEGEGKLSYGESFSLQIEKIFKIVEDQDVVKTIKVYNHK